MKTNIGQKNYFNIQISGAPPEKYHPPPKWVKPPLKKNFSGPPPEHGFWKFSNPP